MELEQLEQEKIVKSLEWIYAALVKGIIIKNDERVIHAIPRAIDLIRDQQKQIKELLEEQESVKPTWSHRNPYCGSCGLQIRSGGKYCSECGKPIAWEDR